MSCCTSEICFDSVLMTDVLIITTLSAAGTIVNQVYWDVGAGAVWTGNLGDLDCTVGGGAMAAAGVNQLEAVASATSPLDGNIASLGTYTGAIDAVTLSVGDRVLIRNQTNPIENGIYERNATGLVRASDFDTGHE